MNQTEIMYFIESALLASDKPLKIDKLLDLFEEEKDQIVQQFVIV